MLLDVQLWLLGRDIAHAGGNALLAYGCERVRAPAGRGGTSAYLPPSTDGGTVIWWGFGAALIRTGASPVPGAAATPASAAIEPDAAGVYIERHAFGPRLLASAPVLPLWTPAQLPRATFPRTAGEWGMARDGVAWIARSFAAYESWSEAALDRAERRRVMLERLRHHRGSAARRALASSAGLRERWDELAERLARNASSAAAGAADGAMAGVRG